MIKIKKLSIITVFMLMCQTSLTSQAVMQSPSSPVDIASIPLTQLNDHAALEGFMAVNLPLNLVFDTFTKKIFADIETTFGTKGIGLDQNQVTHIKKTFLYLIFLVKLDKVQNNPNFTKYQSDFAPYLQDNETPQPHLPSEILVQSPGWMDTTVTATDLQNSQAWQLFCKAMICDIYVYFFTVLQIIHNVEKQTFNYIPHFETSFYNKDYTNLRMINEITRTRLVLEDSIKQRYLNKSQDWQNLPTIVALKKTKSKRPQSSLEQAIINFRNTAFYKETHDKHTALGTQSYRDKPETIPNSKLLDAPHLASPLKEQVWCYYMLSEAYGQITSFINLETLDTVLQYCQNSTLPLSLCPYNMDDYVILNDLLAAKSSIEGTSVKSTNPTPPNFHIEDIRKPEYLGCQGRNVNSCQQNTLKKVAAIAQSSNKSQVQAQSFLSFFSNIGHDIVQAGEDVANGVEAGAKAIEHIAIAAGQGIAGAGAVLVGGFAQLGGDTSISSWANKELQREQKSFNTGVSDLNKCVDDFGDSLKDGVVGTFSELSGLLVGVITDDQKIGNDMANVTASIADTIVNVAAAALKDVTNPALDFAESVARIAEITAQLVVVIVDAVWAAGALVGGSTDGQNEFLQNGELLGKDCLTAIVEGFLDLKTMAESNLAVILTGLGNIVNAVTTTFIDLSREVAYLFTNPIALAGMLAGAFSGPLGIVASGIVGGDISNLIGQNKLNEFSDHVRSLTTNTLEANRSTINQVMGVVVCVATDVAVTVATGGTGTAAAIAADNAIMGAAEATTAAATATGTTAVTTAATGAATATSAAETATVEAIQQTAEQAAEQATKKTAQELADQAVKDATKAAQDATKNALTKAGQKAALEASKKLATSAGQELATTASKEIAANATKELADQAITEVKNAQQALEDATKIAEDAGKVGTKAAKQAAKQAVKAATQNLAAKEAAATTAKEVSMLVAKEAAKAAAKDAAEAVANASIQNAASLAAQGAVEKAAQELTELAAEKVTAQAAQETAQQALEDATTDEAKAAAQNALTQAEQELSNAISKQAAKLAEKQSLDAAADDAADAAAKATAKATAKTEAQEAAETAAKKAEQFVEDDLSKESNYSKLRRFLRLDTMGGKIAGSLAMNVTFSLGSMIGGFNQDQHSMMQEEEQQKALNSLWKFNNENKIAMAQEQLEFLEEIQEKTEAEVGNQALALALTQNITNANVLQLRSAIINMMSPLYAQLLIPVPAIGLPLANIGTSWILETDYIDLYPSQGFFTTTTGRTDFPFAQEVAQAPETTNLLIAPTAATSGKATTTAPDKLWFNQRCTARDRYNQNKLLKKSLDPLSVHIDFQFLYTLNSQFYVGLYLGGNYHDYNSPTYIQKFLLGDMTIKKAQTILFSTAPTLSTTQQALCNSSNTQTLTTEQQIQCANLQQALATQQINPLLVDLDEANLAKMVVLYQDNNNNQLYLGVYEHEGMGWIVQTPLPTTVSLDNLQTYTLQAHLNGQNLSVSLSIDKNPIPIVQQTIQVTPTTNQRTYGIICSGAAMQWNQISPTPQIKTSLRAALANATKEIDQEKAIKVQLAFALNPQFGNFKLQKLSKQAILKGQYVYGTVETDLKKLLPANPYDFVIFGINQNGIITQLGAELSTITPNNDAVIISLVTGAVYDRQGNTLQTLQNVLSAYQTQCEQILAPALVTLITNQQQAILKALSNVTLGGPHGFILDIISPTALQAGQYLYSCTQTMIDNTGKPIINRTSKKTIIDYLVCANVEGASMTMGFAPHASNVNALFSLVTGNVYAKNTVITTDKAPIPMTVHHNQYLQLGTYASGYNLATTAPDYVTITNAQTAYENYLTSQAQQAATKTISEPTPVKIVRITSVQPTHFKKGIHLSFKGRQDGLKPHAPGIPMHFAGKGTISQRQREAAGRVNYSFKSKKGIKLSFKKK